MEFLSFLFFFYLFTISFQAPFLVFPLSFYLSGNSTRCWKCNPSIPTFLVLCKVSLMFGQHEKHGVPASKLCRPHRVRGSWEPNLLRETQTMGYYSSSSDFQRIETALSFPYKTLKANIHAAANMIFFFLTEHSFTWGKHLPPISMTLTLLSSE